VPRKIISDNSSGSDSDEGKNLAALKDAMLRPSPPKPVEAAVRGLSSPANVNDSDSDSESAPEPDYGPSDVEFASDEDEIECATVLNGNPTYDLDDLKWTDRDEPPVANGDPELDEHNGPTDTAKRRGGGHDATPAKFLALYLTVALLTTWVQYTNAWAEDHYSDARHPWKPCTVQEIKTLLGLLLAMTVMELKSVEEYWLKGKTGPYIWPDFGRFMRLGRFKKLWRSLHFNDYTKDEHWSTPAADPLFKLRPIFTHFNLISRALWRVGTYISIDEAMVFFKGRSFFKQYMPKKITKWGFKVRHLLFEKALQYLLIFFNLLA
jgi:hypothetical protein